MRRGLIIAVASLAAMTAASASDVRRSELPDSLWGTWAPSVDACAGAAKLVISAKTHTTGNSSCAIEWVTVTAGAAGPVYSARSSCADAATGTRSAPSVLVLRPSEAGSILVGADVSQLTRYQQCR